MANKKRLNINRMFNDVADRAQMGEAFRLRTDITQFNLRAQVKFRLMLRRAFTLIFS